MSTLKNKAVASIKWTALQTVVVGVIGPLLMIFKARFLSPSEYGVLAILTIVIGFMTLIENFGISQAIIQRDSISKKEYSSLFYFNIAFVCILGGSVFLLSNTLASIFDMAELSQLLKVASFIVIVSGPSLMFRAMLEKSLYFKELSLIKIFSNIILFLLTITLLFNGLGLMGVVYAQLISAIISVLLILFISFKYRIANISLYFSFSKLIPFLSFGIYVFGKQVMTYITHRLDEIIIGVFLSNDVLGIYHFAKNMLETLRSVITASFSKVLFPVLSKMKNDLVKLSSAYIKISKYLSFLAIPVFVGIAITAEFFVPVIFGQQWVESIPFFQAFSLIFIPMILTANLASSLLYSLGQPKTVFYIDLVTSIIYISFLFVFSRYGIFAVLTTYSLYVLFKTFTLQLFTSKQLTYSILNYFNQFKRVILAATIMSLCVLIVQLNISDAFTQIITFIVSVVIGGAVYVVSIYILENSLAKQFFKDVQLRRS